MNIAAPASRDYPRYVGKKSWFIFFLVGFIQSLAALAWIISIPGDPKNSLVLGFSASRLVLMALILTAAFCYLAAGILALRSDRFLRIIQSLAMIRRSIFFAICLVMIFILAAAWGTLVSMHAYPGEATYSVFIRLLPLLTLLCVLSLETLFWFIFVRNGLHWHELKVFSRPVDYFLRGWIACFIFGLVIALTGFGIIPDEFFWGSPGVPLLAWQVGSSALLGLAGFLVFRSMKRPSGWKTDLAIFLLFWVGAYFIWMSQPVPRSYFTPSPRAPNFEIYPYSDAGFYDFVSQSLLTGNGFLNHQIITRPIYAVMLAGFHVIAGQDYKAVIAVQTIFLAVFPALLYLLGKSLHSREVGIITAALAVWRELNLLAATPLTEVSNSKMLMTDSLTGVAFAGLILLLVWWQTRRPNSLTAAMAIGGFFGLMLLLRTQALMTLPVIVLVVLLNRKGGFRRAVAAAALFVLGAAISFSPWLVRNYQLTGQLIMDQPSQTAIHALRYSLSMDSVDESLTTKPPAEVSATVVRFVLDHPIFTAKFMAAHFLNNEFSAIAILPMRLNLVDARDNLFIQTPFWLKGLKDLSPGQAALLAVNLTLVVMGAAFAFWTLKWTGLLPLLIHLSYSASSAVARISGWRFAQPVDWVIYLYYSAGLACLFIAALHIFGWKRKPRQLDDREEWRRPGRKVRWFPFAGITAGLFLLGCITPAMEIVIPQRYPVEDKDGLFGMLLSNPRVSGDAELTGQIQYLKNDPGSTALWGRALYPRYYKEEAGEPGSGWMAYKASPYSKLGFVMITPSGDSQAILPLESAPEYFPNASDVLLVGCKRNGWIEASAILVEMDKNALYLNSQSSAFQCH